MFSSDKTGDMNLSLVSFTERQALYLAEAGRLIKSNYSVAVFFTLSQICVRLASRACGRSSLDKLFRLSY